MIQRNLECSAYYINQCDERNLDTCLSWEVFKVRLWKESPDSLGAIMIWVHTNFSTFRFISEDYFQKVSNTSNIYHDLWVEEQVIFLIQFIFLSQSKLSWWIQPCKTKELSFFLLTLFIDKIRFPIFFFFLFLQ